MSRLLICSGRAFEADSSRSVLHNEMALRLLHVVVLTVLAAPLVAGRPPNVAAATPPRSPLLFAPEVGDVPAPCFFCEYFVGAIKNKIDNLPIAIIEQEITALCEKAINQTLVCDMIAKAVAGTIAKALNTSAEAICHKANFCSAMNDMALKIAISGASLRGGPGSSILCSLCNFAVEQLDDYIWNNQDTLESDVLQICQSLPPGTAEPCADDVKKEFPAILKTVFKYLNPDTVCKAAQICP